jgi:hypothetical protein
LENARASPTFWASISPDSSPGGYGEPFNLSKLPRFERKMHVALDWTFGYPLFQRPRAVPDRALAHNLSFGGREGESTSANVMPCRKRVARMLDHFKTVGSQWKTTWRK